MALTPGTGTAGAVVESARRWWGRSTRRFGQDHALSNARQATTRLLRQRVEREDVRLYLDGLDETAVEGQEAEGAAARRTATGADS